MLRLVQLNHPDHGRRVAVVEEPKLRLLETPSVYALAHHAIDSSRKLAETAVDYSSAETLDYDPVYSGQSPWKLLPAFDHPEEESRCFVMGTGLTHKASASMRQAMHGKPAEETDSMRM